MPLDTTWVGPAAIRFGAPLRENAAGPVIAKLTLERTVTVHWDAGSPWVQLFARPSDPFQIQSGSLVVSRSDVLLGGATAFGLTMRGAEPRATTADIDQTL
ncbi:MAG: hypothetical protein GY811_31005 [Myxococcales bacterium]|nr:hypothetical protein [Myxococcales bacterium]